MVFRAWGVVCPKGNAVFLDHTRAMEYAAKHHGVVVKLLGQTNYELPEEKDQNASS